MFSLFFLSRVTVDFDVDVVVVDDDVVDDMLMLMLGVVVCATVAIVVLWRLYIMIIYECMQVIILVIVLK